MPPTNLTLLSGRYLSFAEREEIALLHAQKFSVRAAADVPVFVHVRSASRIEPGSSIESVAEVIAAAAVSGAALHIVHINSSCLGDAGECLGMIEGARARGLDVTVEAYPYGAAAMAISTALLSPGWRERLGIDYGDLQSMETGERLTRERFEALAAQPGSKAVLVFLNTDEVVDAVMRHPLVMVASDSSGGIGHPRTAGSFTRFLARYVRQRGEVPLMEALRRMTLMPAQRLEKATPAARKKGRLQEGADADVVVFDLERVSDRATYASPGDTSIGMRYVLVAGSGVVEDGEIRPGVAPGRPLVGRANPP